MGLGVFTSAPAVGASGCPPTADPPAAATARPARAGVPQAPSDREVLETGRRWTHGARRVGRHRQLAGRRPVHPARRGGSRLVFRPHPGDQQRDEEPGRGTPGGGRAPRGGIPGRPHGLAAQPPPARPGRMGPGQRGHGVLSARAAGPGEDRCLRRHRRRLDQPAGHRRGVTARQRGGSAAARPVRTQRRCRPGDAREQHGPDRPGRRPGAARLAGADRAAGRL